MLLLTCGMLLFAISYFPFFLLSYFFDTNRDLRDMDSMKGLSFNEVCFGAKRRGRKKETWKEMTREESRRKQEG